MSVHVMVMPGHVTVLFLLNKEIDYDLTQTYVVCADGWHTHNLFVHILSYEMVSPLSNST